MPLAGTPERSARCLGSAPSPLSPRYLRTLASSTDFSQGQGPSLGSPRRAPGKEEGASDGFLTTRPISAARTRCPAPGSRLTRRRGPKGCPGCQKVRSHQQAGRARRTAAGRASPIPPGLRRHTLLLCPAKRSRGRIRARLRATAQQSEPCAGTLARSSGPEPRGSVLSSRPPNTRLRSSLFVAAAPRPPPQPQMGFVSSPVPRRRARCRPPDQRRYRTGCSRWLQRKKKKSSWSK